MKIEPIATDLQPTEDTEQLFRIISRLIKKNETRPRDEWDAVIAQPIMTKNGTLRLLTVAMPYDVWNEINEVILKHSASIYVTTEFHRGTFESGEAS